MASFAFTYPSPSRPARLRARRPRPFFLRGTAQQMRSPETARELVRAALSLAGLAAWALLAALVTG